MHYEDTKITFIRLPKSEPDYFRLNYLNSLNYPEIILLCVDLSNLQTIHSFSDDYFEIILQDILQNPEKQYKIIVVGCKCDKKVRNKIEENNLKLKCQELNINYVPISSYKNYSIDILFGMILDYQNKNIKTSTIQEQISILQTSKYMDAVSALRDEF